MILKDMAILVTARAAKDADFSVYDYLERYSESQEDREYLTSYLSLMGMVNETWKHTSQWDPRWDLDHRGEYILIWSD